MWLGSLQKQDMDKCFIFMLSFNEESRAKESTISQMDMNGLWQTWRRAIGPDPSELCSDPSSWG